jgi:rhodanese-related sulfurtransferase
MTAGMDLTVDQLRELGENGATVINAGAHAGSQEIRGAIRYRPSDLLAASHLVLPLPTDRPIVLYDEHGNSERLAEIAEKLRASGFADVFTLVGGFAAYKAADDPLQEATLEQVVPPTKPQEVNALDHRL